MFARFLNTRLPLPVMFIWLALSCMLSSSCSFSPKECLRLFNESKNDTFDMVIVPGIPFDGLHWNDTMKGRIHWAKYLYDHGIARNLMFSGSSVYTPYNEAEIMAMYAIKLGVPAEHVYTETSAEHSTENVYYSYRKAKKLGFKKMAVASDPFQTRMLRRFIRTRVDPDVKLLPFVVDIMMSMHPYPPEPEIDFKAAFRKDFTPMPERVGFFQRFMGTLGYNLDTTLYR